MAEHETVANTIIKTHFFLSDTSTYSKKMSDDEEELGEEEQGDNLGVSLNENPFVLKIIFSIVCRRTKVIVTNKMNVMVSEKQHCLTEIHTKVNTNMENGTELVLIDSQIQLVI